MAGAFPKSAAWVAAILRASGLSQEAFAEKADLSRSGLTKWLAGLQQPRYESLQKLRRVAPPHLQDPENWTDTTQPVPAREPAPQAPSVPLPSTRPEYNAGLRAAIRRRADISYARGEKILEQFKGPKLDRVRELTPEQWDGVLEMLLDTIPEIGR